MKLDKDQLVDLYYTYIIPLPQRTYRNNRRGREMTRRQIAQAKKRKSSSVETGSSDKKKMKSADSESRFLTPYNLPLSGERIKPPPSCIDFGKKKIKLGSGSSSTKERILPVSSDEKTTSPIRLKEIAASLDEVHSELSKVTEQTKSAIFPEKKIIKLNNKRPQTGCKISQTTSDGVPEKKNDQVEPECMDTSTKISTKKTFKAAKISWP
ncbi:uncharacterized protein LOC125673838 isoform X2 [Ostrea edulis]|nr:uncharacterized protein LOC125673838 isoform X2 [Ostrea edulis]